MHPGAVAINIGVYRNTGFGKPVFRTLFEGAETVFYLAASDETAGLTGHYLIDNKNVATSSKTTNTELVLRFWTLDMEREAGWAYIMQRKEATLRQTGSHISGGFAYL
ncbi:hypothetical protein [Paenibacillus luteus]|uniref:hypothetical protein n=1 Tax=Paenibacillus luteus TaxID=2545753 RepID=UPI0019D6305C|nr:hypothetical protein [Paenibacillus luteus]